AARERQADVRVALLLAVKDEEDRSQDDEGESGRRKGERGKEKSSWSRPGGRRRVDGTTQWSGPEATTPRRGSRAVPPFPRPHVSSCLPAFLRVIRRSSAARETEIARRRRYSSAPCPRPSSSTRRTPAPSRRATRGSTARRSRRSRRSCGRGRSST